MQRRILWASLLRLSLLVRVASSSILVPASQRLPPPELTDECVGPSHITIPQNANCSDLGPTAAPRAVIFEILPFHDEVLPSSIRFAHMHGLPCVDVMLAFDQSDPHDSDPRGAVYLIEWLNISGVSVHKGASKSQIDLLIRHSSVALVEIQTFEWYGSKRTRKMLQWITTRVRAQVPIFVGCHNVDKCEDEMALATAVHPRNLLPLIPLCFTYQTYSQLINSNRRSMFLHPTWMVPGYMGSEAAFCRERAFATASMLTKPTTFAVFSAFRVMDRPGAKDWDSLRTLSDIEVDLGNVRILLFGKDHVRAPHTLHECVSAWIHLNDTLRTGTSGRVHIERIRGSWRDGLAVAARADFVLPMIVGDTSGNDSSAYLRGKLTSSVALALAIHAPLVLWDKLAAAYGLTMQFTYSGRHGFRDAVRRAITSLASAPHDETRSCARSATSNSAYGRAMFELCQKQHELLEVAMKHSRKNTVAISWINSRLSASRLSAPSVAVA